MDAAKELRKDAKPLVAGTGLRVQMTGAAPQQLDSQESSNQTLQIVGLATILLILVLLALIFRSILICLMPIVLVGLAGTIAIGLIAWANQIFGLKADSSIEVILFVVLYGIGTDYILFFLFRYREQLRTGDDTKGSVLHALERAGEAIASAGGAVIVAFMALLLSSLSIFRSIGPALAIAVAVTLLAALTLVPAVVTLLGKRLFFPSKKYLQEPEAARFGAIGRRLGQRPLAFATVSGVALAVLAVFALGFNPTFDFTSSLPKNVESTKALEALQKGLPPGATDPTTVLLQADGDGQITQAEVDSFQQTLGGATGVARVDPGVLSPTKHAAAFNVVLDHDPGSDASIANVKGPIRTTAHRAAPEGTTAYVGGTTSVFVDMQRGDEPRLRGGVPRRCPRDHADLGPAAAQPGRTVVPDGLGRPRIRRDARRDRPGHPAPQGRLRADLHAADLHLPVRGGTGHRLQHLDGGPAAGGGPRGPRSPRERPRRRSSTPGRRSPPPG